MCQQIAIPLRVFRPSQGGCDDDHVAPIGDVQQRRDEGLAGLAAPVFEQQGGCRFAESGAESQFAANSSARAAINPCVSSTDIPRKHRSYRRIQQAGRLFRCSHGDFTTFRNTSALQGRFHCGRPIGVLLLQNLAPTTSMCKPFGIPSQAELLRWFHRVGPIRSGREYARCLAPNARSERFKRIRPNCEPCRVRTYLLTYP
jgi:hypothetical protein